VFGVFHIAGDGAVGDIHGVDVTPILSRSAGSNSSVTSQLGPILAWLAGRIDCCGTGRVALLEAEGAGAIGSGAPEMPLSMD
jgi:hypothetical protein